jgi:serine/threonine protein kinase
VEVITLGQSLADALSYLHDSGVWHGDLKPSNVGFTAAGQVKVFDLGIAVRCGTESTPGGTILYLSAEILGGAPVDSTSDLWSLAVLLAEAWIGRHPLADLPVAQQLSDLRTGALWSRASGVCPSDDPRLADVLARALSPNPDRRFRTAVEFGAALTGS